MRDRSFPPPTGLGRVLVGLAIVAVAVSGARAQPRYGRDLAVAGDGGTCPSPVAIAAELERIAPQLRAWVARPGGDDALWVVEEPGGFRLELRGVRRHFEDPGRDCLRRTKMAAVSASLLVGEEDGSVDRASVHAAPAPAPLTTPQPARLRRPARSIELSLAARLSGGLRTDGPSVEAAGAALRLVVGGALARASMGLAFDGPMTVRSSALRVRLLRLPLDVSARIVALSRPAIELSVDAGFWLAVLELANLEGPPQTSLRFDYGLRVGVTGRVRLRGRLHLAIAVEDSLSFAPVALVVAETGSIAGRTPRDWLTLLVGLALSFD